MNLIQEDAALKGYLEKHPVYYTRRKMDSFMFISYENALKMRSFLPDTSLCKSGNRLRVIRHVSSVCAQLALGQSKSYCL